MQIEKLIVVLLTPVVWLLAAYLAYKIGLLMLAVFLIIAILHASNTGD